MFTHFIRAFVQISVVLTTLGSAPLAQAQNKSVYKSEADELVTVRRLTLLPVFDNVRGIYSRPIEAHLLEALKSNHHFELAESTSAGAILTPEEIEDNFQLSQEIARSLNSDAFIASKVVKGPSGITIRMSLFLVKDAKLLAREEIQNIQRLDLEGLKKQSENLVFKLLRALPYEGVVLSRQGTRVTLNLGKRDGVVADQGGAPGGHRGGRGCGGRRARGQHARDAQTRPGPQHDAGRRRIGCARLQQPQRGCRQRLQRQRLPVVSAAKTKSPLPRCLSKSPSVSTALPPNWLPPDNCYLAVLKQI